MDHNHMLATPEKQHQSSHYQHGDSPQNQTRTHASAPDFRPDALNSLGPPPSLPFHEPHAIPLTHASATTSSSALTSPPAYPRQPTAAAATGLDLPDVPSHDLVLPPPKNLEAHARNNDYKMSDESKSLPPLSSLTAASFHPDDGHPAHPSATSPSLSHPQWQPLYPNAQFQSLPSMQQLQRFDSPSTMDVDGSSNSVVSAASPDRYQDGRANSVNLDDPDVRLAAEALGDLRADFIGSPASNPTGLPLASPQTLRASTQSPGPEPLFALLTTSHPFLANTLEGASSAYGGAKNFSPRFKSSAEYVEGYLTPLANTVGSVGRVTGVEGGVRWFLGGSRRHGSDLEAGSGSRKRRKVNGGSLSGSSSGLETESLNSVNAMQPLSNEVEQDLGMATPRGDRRLSMASTIDTLPAYDEMRSPEYTESMDAEKTQGGRSAHNPAWQSRLIMSTSGLSVAMSEESLRSLKYCLRWLRWANEHISSVIGALKTTLEQYEQAGNPEMAQLEASAKMQEAGFDNTGAMVSAQSRGQLANRINTLKGDVLKTLQDVINTVSKYAGGALPENARVLVRRHLTSLPQRFRVASMSDNSSAASEGDANDTAMREGTRKVLVLAKEGLDMVGQISGVVDGTIVSAEEWCDRMGKKRPSEAQEESMQEREKRPPPVDAAGDVKMG